MTVYANELLAANPHEDASVVERTDQPGGRQVDMGGHAPPVYPSHAIRYGPASAKQPVCDPDELKRRAVDLDSAFERTRWRHS